MKLSSSAFQDGSPIPVDHTCDGRDAAPPLAWSDPPPGTKSFALICDDPDAPGKTWVHWVLFNIRPDAGALRGGGLAGALEGMTDFQRTGYGGPCPPPGKPHRYYFTLYALDATLPLQAGATKADVERAMQGHVLAEARLMGTYGRSR